MVLGTDKVVCHANSVMGLVESLVGLVPGGGGVKEMLHRVKMHKLQFGVSLLFKKGVQDHCMLLMVLHILRIQILLPKKLNQSKC